MVAFGSRRLTYFLGSSLVALAAFPAGAARAQEAPAAGDAIVVTGSRIPRVATEGPAPITVITAETILQNGYSSVPDILRAVTQNGGETQSQQSGSAADFSPGAQQVDLRGLGPNHTLVLVNGRRIADFPLPYQGRSNFTDISNIPVGLIDRVEVLSGSASAIYGSDAIAGVINFTLKKKVDGTTLDYRHGFTEHGGAASHRFTGSTGFAAGGFNAAIGAEYSIQKPLWAYQRKQQDSTADNPATDTPLARRVFLRFDPNEEAYVDPGLATCAALSGLNGGTNYYASRPNWGPYDPVIDDYGPGFFCGSNESIGYGTIISRRSSFNSYAALSFEVSDTLELFTDIQLGFSNVALMPDVQSWAYQDATGSADSTFYNSFGDYGLDDWSRQFTPEESGGFGTTMTRNRQTTFSITPGVKGSFGGGDWNYELSFNHSEFRSKVKFPQIVASAANTFFLGTQQGIDPDSGYAIFNANPAKLYTPLTPAQYASISTYSIYKPRSWTDNLSATLNNTELFQLPAGPVGFAAVAELGKQGYDLRPDPLALGDYYYSWQDSDGSGKRSHWALGGELRVPVIEMLQLSGAGRYDRFRFGGSGIGKFTYNVGAELRPLSSLLVRAAYGTGFRAPDLHYVFTGPGNLENSATDYYRCRTEEPDEDIGDCSYSDEGIQVQRNGNRRLKPETAKSLNAGVVFAPVRGFDISVDYFRVSMTDQVNDLRVDGILRDEADCRLGQTDNGTAVDRNSPTCLDAIARVQRFTSGANADAINLVKINPINIASEKTSGIDVAFHGRIDTGIGEFALSAAHTHVFKHTIRQYLGDAVEDKLAADSGYYIPRDKSTASLNWSLDKISWTVSGTRLGKLPNWDEDAYIRASYLFNTSVQYNFTDHVRGSLTVNNLFDTNPVKDATYASYPYYDSNWFDTVGRSVYLELTWKLGGKAL